MVPSPQPLVRWMAIFNIFDATTTYAVFLSIGVCPLFVYVCSHLRKTTTIGELHRLRTLSGVFFTFFCMISGNSMRHTPRTTFFRTCAFLWALYSLIICTLFASKWISFLTHVPYNAMMTDEDILESDIPLKFTNATANYFTHVGHLSDDKTLKIMKRAQICRRIRDCLDEAAKNRY